MAKVKDVADKKLKRRAAKFVSIFGILVATFSAIFIWAVTTSGYSVVGVVGDSMNPTLKHGDTLILKQTANPTPGTIFVFNKPKTWTYVGLKDSVIIKRVAAHPGDVLSFDGEAFFVNGEVAYALKEDDYECAAGEVGFEHQLTKSQIFVMGDNAPVSLDSRRIFCDGNTGASFVPKYAMIDYGEIERIF